MADAFVTLVSIQSSQSSVSAGAEKFQNRPQAGGKMPAALYEARRLRAVMRAEEREGSGSILPPIVTKRPTILTNLAALAGAAPSHTVQLTWDAQDRADYVIRIGTTPIFDPVTWDTQTLLAGADGALVATFVHVNATPGTTYYYVVIPHNTYGWGLRSETVASATIPLDPPLAPKSFQLFAAALDSPMAWWLLSANALSYALYWKLTAGVTKSDARIWPVAPPFLMNLAGGGPIYARLAAVGVAGEGALTAESNIMISTPAPAAPVLTAGLGVQSGYVALSWTAVSGVVSYTLSRSLAAGGPFVAIQVLAPGTTSFVDTGLTEKTTYYYRIHATKQYGGDSAESNTASTVPYGSPPVFTSQPSVSSTTATTVTINYVVTDTEGDHYQLETSLDNGVSWQLYAANEAPGAHTIVFAGLTSGATYNIGLRATTLTGAPAVVTSSFAVAVPSTTVYRCERPAAQYHVVNTVSGIQKSFTWSGAGTVEIDYYTQGEANYDGIIVNIDGVAKPLITSAAGITATISYPVAIGAHLISVTYRKDGSGDVGLDTAWITALRVKVAAVVVATDDFTNGSLGISGTPTGWAVAAQVAGGMGAWVTK